MAQVVNYQEPFSAIGSSLASIGSGAVQQQNINQQRGIQQQGLDIQQQNAEQSKIKNMTDLIHKTMQLEPGQRGLYLMQLKTFYGVSPQELQQIATVPRRPNRAELERQASQVYSADLRAKAIKQLGGDLK